jgi:hypothetical protein
LAVADRAEVVRRLEVAVHRLAVVPAEGEAVVEHRIGATVLLQPCQKCRKYVELN